MLHTYGSWEVFFLCSPNCPKQPRTSFPFYKLFYPTISDRISESNTKISFDIKIFTDKDIISQIAATKKDLLSHPIVEAFLIAKWDSVKKWYYFNGFFYFLFICNLTNLLYLNQFDIKGELKIMVFCYQNCSDLL